MLQVTDSALEILKEAREEGEAPEEAGVRLRSVLTEQGDTIRVDFVDEPQQGDQVIEEPGLRVFVSGDLVEPLNDRTLDATETPAGRRLAIR